MFCLLAYLFIVRKWKKRARRQVHKQSWEKKKGKQPHFLLKRRVDSWDRAVGLFLIFLLTHFFVVSTVFPPAVPFDLNCLTHTHTHTHTLDRFHRAFCISFVTSHSKSSRTRRGTFILLFIVCLCILFSQSNQIQYNIILYNIQKRKTEKV